jgi:TPR repeat protein
VKFISRIIAIFLLTNASVSLAEFEVPTLMDIKDALTEEGLEEAAMEYRKARLIRSRKSMSSDEERRAALSLFESSARKGNVYAMHNLALALEHGLDAPTNVELGAQWYILASKIGFAGSQNNLGDDYETGSGVSLSKEKAIYWYTQAAMQGEPTAYLSLGSIFLGLDDEESAYWLNLAVANLPDGLNLADAKVLLRTATSRLSKRQIDEARLRAKLFAPLRETRVKISDRITK